MAPPIQRWCQFIFLTVVLLQFSNQASLSPALKYLVRFGYLDPRFLDLKSSIFFSEDRLKLAIKNFQAFAGIKVTGVLDGGTLAMMDRPRCSLADLPQYGTKRFTLQGFKWKGNNITYKLSRYPSSLHRDKVDEEIQKSFDIWSKVIPLTFTKKKSGPVHIEVKFQSGEHGDDDPFDGPGGIFGHFFFPVQGGDAHFDDSELWTVKSNVGINLFQAATHAFGHSLGLLHSQNKASVMSPFYKGYKTSFDLNKDDVEDIQTLYGPKAAKTPFFKDGPKNQDDNELCSGEGIDTIFNSAEGITIVFKGSKYWRLTDDAVAAGYPKLIRNGWPGLPENIDAAFTYKNGRTYFFKGGQYWRYIGSEMDGVYPKKISDGFSGVPDNLDAAMVWSGDGKIYFFKGSQFWRYDPSSKPPVCSNYPKPISNWEGVPNNINAAFQYTNGYTYFFKKGEYYRFNDREFSVDHGVPPFPRPAGYWWFGCIETQ